METLLKDFRYGIRGLTKRPSFTAIAVLTLALAIGASTAIFSVVNAVLLRPLPFTNPDRLVMVWEDASYVGFPHNTPATANYADWKARNHVFEDMAALDSRSFSLTGDGDPEKIEAAGVTANLFPLLGTRPLIGRNFTAEEDQPDANKVVILSQTLWQRRYAGDQSVVGHALLLNGEKYTVIGVMPAGFQFSDKDTGIWVPIAFTPRQLANRGRHYLNVVARMKPGVKLAEADADVRAIQQQIARENPEAAGRLGAYVRSLTQEFTGEIRRPLLVLLAAVGLVLLIACANIANLLLSRAAGRRREIALRTALGASRLRIIRQLLIESLLLASAGAVLGVVFAWWSFAFLQRLIPEGLTLFAKLSLDPKVLAFTFVVMVVTAVLFGLAPALQASNLDLNEALKQGGRTGQQAGSKRLRNVLVVGEVALAMVLLVGAGLLIQTLFKLQNQYANLKAQSVMTLRTVLTRNKYPEHGQRVGFYKQVLERVSALPGVVSAGYATSVPLAWKGGTSGFTIEGRSVEQALAGGFSYDANHRQVSADYLKTIGIPIRAGRSFTEADNEQAVHVAIINETMAREYWPGENPLGKRIKFGDPTDDVPWVTIVGVAGDIRQMGIDQPIKAELYVPYQQDNGLAFYAPRDLAIRTSVDPSSVVAAARNEIHQVDPDQPISNVRGMNEVLDEETASRRLGMTLLTIFAGLALLLATIGIYGVLAFFVTQHTQEIGVRMALGAQRGSILGLVLKKGMLLAGLGVVIGLGAAFAVTRLMASLLYDVSATDPLTYVAIATLLLGVALVACLVPARRAMRVDPLVALRYE
ncbi:MAG TPA: ABC transporter permease [Pyrinomonadaceae bacterium]|nr:ABC transporter permease [Pyrinomonadaceae bacterium]